jgi:hypothetical protein
MPQLTPAFEDPMKVPYVFSADDASAAKMADEWLKAASVSVDTETDYDQSLDLNIEVAEPRVLSAFAAFTATEGIDPEGLITGEDLPEMLREQGYVAAKAYVLDLGYIDPAAIAEQFAKLDVYVWNGRFERKVFERFGVRANRLLDLMLYQAVLDQGAEGFRFYTGLARASESYLGWSLEGKGGIQLSYRPVEVLPELSDEQLAYASQDAVATGLLAPLIVAACEAVTVTFDGITRTLADIGELESRASVFLDKMSVTGVPFVARHEADQPIVVDGQGYANWLAYVAERERRQRLALDKIAEIEHRLNAEESGAAAASQGLLSFDGGDVRYEPSFEPGSHKQLINALNRIIPDEVRAYTARHLGRERLLTDADTVDKNMLKLLGGELAKALIEWSKHNKLANDAGTKFVDQWVKADGRLHPEVKQGLVATGRLSMANPPMQNRPPETKRFSREAEPYCVVYADLSQAELRTLAHMSRDERMTSAFVAGEDLHTVTAVSMFNLDIKTMMAAEVLSDEALIEASSANRVEVPAGRTELDGDGDRILVVGNVEIARSALVETVLKAAKKARGTAKVPNFGVAYGMSPARLATTLCLTGVDTTTEEGKRILDAWMDTYPGVKRWLEDRDAFIEDLAANPPACDFRATWKLLDWFKPVTDARFALKRRLGRFPTVEEIADHLHPADEVATEFEQRVGRPTTDEELVAERASRAEFVAWVLSYRTPVVVAADGTPFAFASRTLGGRRRLFQVSADAWMESMTTVIVRSDKPLVRQLRDRFATKHRLRLSGQDGKALGFAEARRAVPKNLHKQFVLEVLSGMGKDAAKVLGSLGLSDSIRAKKQQFRNGPIQGTVGDVALLAYALLDERLERFNGLVVPTLTVHDSIMLRSHLSVAREASKVLQETMEEALEFYCPSVPAKADAAILHSYAEDDVVAEELLDHYEQLAAAGIVPDEPVHVEEAA